MRDIKSNIDVAQTLAPAARTSTATGSSVDLQGYKSACFALSVGAITTGGVTFAAQESDDDSTWATVAAADLDGAFPNLETGSPTFNGLNYRVGYKGHKRYVRVVATHAGSPSGDAVYGCNVIREPLHRPAA